MALLDDNVVRGRYEVLDEIASGGMASVHLGRLIGPVGFARTVAIKRLHDHFAKDPDFITMFLDEARLAARVAHSNVVSTLDIITTGGEVLLVLEYVHGETLSRLLRRALLRGQCLPLPTVVSIVSGVLHGLHAAHEAKDELGRPLSIVHRDVSPQNILIGVDGIARILDFGVAKATGQLHLTREGQLRGKLGYMAPEQLLGLRVTRSSDVYAAGVVLWEVLAGARLFESDIDVSSRVKEHAGVPPLRQRAPHIGEELGQVVMRALEREPEARWGSAREMALALQRCAPLAPPSAVGEWVEATAKDALEQRAAVVASIGRSGSQDAAGAVNAEVSGTDPTWSSKHSAESAPENPAASLASPTRPAQKKRFPRLALVGAATAASGLLSFWLGAPAVPAPAAAHRPTEVASSPPIGPSLARASPSAARRSRIPQPPWPAAARTGTRGPPAYPVSGSCSIGTRVSL